MSKLNKFLYGNYWLWLFSRIPFYPLLVLLNLTDIIQEVFLIIIRTDWTIPVSKDSYNKIKLEIYQDEMLCAKSRNNKRR